ncbi:CinA family protein [Mycoplasmatota bacterium]|nr:CinA family protein [Mycoplasmatota bacterium]
METLVKEVSLLSEDLVKKCIEKNQKIVFAESMTGGLLASLVTSIPDASKVLKESFVVYSNEAKVKILNCKRKTIDQYSVYSKEIIEEMLEGLLSLSNASIRVAVSGIAGPKSYHDVQVGTVYIGIYIGDQKLIFKKKFQGDRQTIQYKTCIFIFKTIMNNI